MNLAQFKQREQQLMPVGFLAMVNALRDQRKLEELKNAGINLVHRYYGSQSIEHAWEDLAYARGVGIGVLQNLPSTFFKTKGTAYWQEYISALVSDDQICMWYLPEEVKPELFDKYARLANIIRKCDRRNRPIISYSANWQPDHLRHLGGILDAVGFGSYPDASNLKRLHTMRRIDHAHDCGAGEVIAVLQAYKNTKRPGSDWPRPKDIRFDAYLSLISGAKGILWYGYHYAKDKPDMLQAILEVATELNGPEALGEVLLMGKEPKIFGCTAIEGPARYHEHFVYGSSSKKFSVNYASIQWTARGHRGSLYIFAVNTAQKLGAKDDGGVECTVKAEFGPVDGDKVIVIGENRTIEVKEGYFVDTFEPLSTHIYKTKQ